MCLYAGRQRHGRVSAAERRNLFFSLSLSSFWCLWRFFLFFLTVLYILLFFLWLPCGDKVLMKVLRGPTHALVSRPLFCLVCAICMRSRFLSCGSFTTFFLFTRICSVSFHVARQVLLLPDSRVSACVCVLVQFFHYLSCALSSHFSPFQACLSSPTQPFHPIVASTVWCRCTRTRVYLTMFVMSADPRLVDPSSLCDSCHDAPARLQEPRRSGQGGGGAARRRAPVISLSFCVLAVFCFFLLYHTFSPHRLPRATVPSSRLS